jgi:toxin ParE1/3/4
VAGEASESAATELLDRFEGRFNQVLKLPLSGAARPQLAEELRVVFCERYAIYYVPRTEEVVVVRVLHGARDVEAIAEEGGFTPPS